MDDKSKKSVFRRLNLKKINLKTMGIGVFMFFLIKGLIWLAVFFGLFKLAGG